MQFGKGCIWVVFKEGKNNIRIMGKGDKTQALIYYCFSEKHKFSQFDSCLKRSKL